MSQVRRALAVRVFGQTTIRDVAIVVVWAAGIAAFTVGWIAFLTWLLGGHWS